MAKEKAGLHMVVDMKNAAIPRSSRYQTQWTRAQQSALQAECVSKRAVLLLTSPGREGTKWKQILGRVSEGIGGAVAMVAVMDGFNPQCLPVVFAIGRLES